MKLEGRLLYCLVTYQSSRELYLQGLSFNLQIMHNPTLLFDLDLHDRLHTSPILLHVKVGVDTMGHAICISRGMSTISQG